jgi:hypothetical protein
MNDRLELMITNGNGLKNKIYHGGNRVIVFAKFRQHASMET